MKKTLLLFIGCVQFFGTIAQETNIVNRDFETWNDKTFEHLTGLRDAMEEQIEHTFPDSIVLSKSSDAKEGSYSLRMDTKYDDSSDTTSGYFIVGAWGDQGPSGGVPFTLQADSLVGWYKYDVMPGDTAWIILNLKNAGSTIAGG